MRKRTAKIGSGSNLFLDLVTFVGLLDKVQQYEQQEIDLSAMQQRVARPKYLMLDG